LQIVPNLKWFITGTGFQKPLNRSCSDSQLDVPLKVQSSPCLQSKISNNYHI
jgi:hypothetical protein